MLELMHKMEWFWEWKGELLVNGTVQDLLDDLSQWQTAPIVKAMAQQHGLLKPGSDKLGDWKNCYPRQSDGPQHL